jgi:type I restriction enzyme R subunit
VIDDRTRLVARKVSDLLKESGDRFQKTIVFCVDTEHAARMRTALVNENSDLCAHSPRYAIRITGNDDDGVDQLDNFIDPESKFPVIVTTSRLLSTGVDAQTCRVIALDREVGSMTEFKQILGRGTRVHEETKKYYFTLVDFRKATNHFADPDFDGDPIQIYEPGPEDPITPPDVPPSDDGEPIPPMPGDDETTIVDVLPPWDVEDVPSRKIYVDNVTVKIVAQRVEYLDEYGKLVTQSLRDFTKNKLRSHFAGLDGFLTRWRGTDRKQAIIEELEQEGLQLDALAQDLGLDLDPFDLICHVAYDQPSLTRRQRADKVRRNDVFTKYGPQARAVLEALLQKYQDEGVTDLGDPRILQITPFDSMGTPLQLIKQFGGRGDFERAVHELQSALYEGAA